MTSKMGEYFEAVNMAIGNLEKRMREFERYAGPKESGAVRRASMDLTRALAEMRAGSTRALAEMRAGK